METNISADSQWELVIASLIKSGSTADPLQERGESPDPGNSDILALLTQTGQQIDKPFARIDLGGWVIDSRQGLVSAPVSPVNTRPQQNPVFSASPAAGSRAMLPGTQFRTGTRVNLLGWVIDSQQGVVSRLPVTRAPAYQPVPAGNVKDEDINLAMLQETLGVAAGQTTRMGLQGLKIDSQQGLVKNSLPDPGIVTTSVSQVDEPNDSATVPVLAMLTGTGRTPFATDIRMNLRGLVIDSQHGVVSDSLLEPEVIDEPITKRIEKSSIVAVTTAVFALNTRDLNSDSPQPASGVVFDFGNIESSSRSVRDGKSVGISPDQATEKNPLPSSDEDTSSTKLASLKVSTGEVTRQSPGQQFEGGEPAPPAEESLSELSVESLSVFEPSVAAYVQYDNNVYLSGDNAQSDTLAVISPTIRYRYKERKSQVDIDYNLETGKYFESSWANYTDHHFLGDWELKVDKRQLLKLSASYIQSNESRSFGSTDDSRASLVGHPTGYQDVQFGLGYAYGNRLDRSHLELNGFTQRIELDDGDFNRSLDNRRVSGLTFGYFWHVKRRMSLFTEARYKTIDFDALLRDSEQARIVVGSEILLSRRFTGKARFGYEQKTFDNLPSSQDYADTVWDLSFTWTPGPNTTIKLEAAKDLNEVEEAGDSVIGVFAVRKDLGIDWTQDWTQRFSTRLDVRLQVNDVQGTPREDKLTWIRLAAIFELFPGLSLGLDGSFESRKFNLAPDADRSTIRLTAEYSF